MPWKNGGGETSEIAVSPDGAELDAFDWRISMARVAVDGPFSAFPGVDRTLTVLEGGGLRLKVGDDSAVDLMPGSRPLSFPADVRTAARLLDGPVLDLNVMTRREAFHHSVERLAVTGRMEIQVAASTALLVCAPGRSDVDAGQGGVDLGSLDYAAPGPAHASEPDHCRRICRRKPV